MAKKEADRISYGWDSIIDCAHDGTSARYELVARELTRPDRFQCRILSKSFFDAYCEFSRIKAFDHAATNHLGWHNVVLFPFMEDGKEPRERRKAMLSAMCFVARGLHPENKKVVGVATEAANRSYDFCVRVQPDWTARDKQTMVKIQKQTGIFVNPKKTMDGEDDEYPLPK